MLIDTNIPVRCDAENCSNVLFVPIAVGGVIRAEQFFCAIHEAGWMFTPSDAYQQCRYFCPACSGAKGTK